MYQSVTLPEPISKDPDDDKFIACAMSAQANVIISGNSDLLEIYGYANITVLKPKQSWPRNLGHDCLGLMFISGEI